MSKVLELLRSFQTAVSTADFWSGFRPDAVPLAVYDGSHTYLCNHPSPPSSFRALSEDGIWISLGRLPGVVANSVACIEGVDTATAFYLEQQVNINGLVALLAHEAFHVYQRSHFRGKNANEASLFLYPVTDARLLAQRRLETYALAKALAAEKVNEIHWLCAALHYRELRFSEMDREFVSYERAIERYEGTATYIECQCAGKAPYLPPEGFKAVKVRQRGYQTGAALCFFLNDLLGNWQAKLESGKSLDELLKQALDSSPEDKHVTEQQASAVLRQAEDDVRQLLQSRREALADFAAFNGYKLTLIAADWSLLKVEGFDPLNVEVIDKDVLHKRYLKLVTPSGSLEVIDTSALTQSQSEHPLFGGVQSVTINSEDKFALTEFDGKMSIVSSKVNGHLKCEVKELTEDSFVLKVF